MFDKLPHDLKDKIFKFNRPYNLMMNRKQRQSQLYYDDCINELQLINLWCNTPQQMKEYIYHLNNRFCIACECCDGCNDDWCYYNNDNK